MRKIFAIIVLSILVIGALWLLIREDKSLTRLPDFSAKNVGENISSELEEKHFSFNLGIGRNPEAIVAKTESEIALQEAQTNRPLQEAQVVEAISWVPFLELQKASAEMAGIQATSDTAVAQQQVLTIKASAEAENVPTQAKLKIARETALTIGGIFLLILGIITLVGYMIYNYHLAKLKIYEAQRQAEIQNKYIVQLPNGGVLVLTTAGEIAGYVYEGKYLPKRTLENPQFWAKIYAQLGHLSPQISIEDLRD